MVRKESKENSLERRLFSRQNHTIPLLGVCFPFSQPRIAYHTTRTHSATFLSTSSSGYIRRPYRFPASHNSTGWAAQRQLAFCAPHIREDFEESPPPYPKREVATTDHTASWGQNAKNASDFQGEHTRRVICQQQLVVGLAACVLPFLPRLYLPGRTPALAQLHEIKKSKEITTGEAVQACYGNAQGLTPQPLLQQSNL